jgi:uncharacterized protein YecT (DUF1311 family)
MGKFLLATLTTATLLSLGIATRTISSTTPNTTDIQIAQNPNCNNPQTQTAMNACSAIAYQNADKKLNQIYKQLMPQLSASRKQKLVTAQQAWIKFRDASCVFERSEVEGGSMAPMVYNDCLTTFTEQRIKDLQRYSDGR